MHSTSKHLCSQLFLKISCYAKLLKFLLSNSSWEFEESEEDPVTSIPYQLQRLFVLLQTSKKRAIETTDVTRSFGWDSSEGEHLCFPVTRFTWLICVFLSVSFCICTLNHTFCVCF